MTKTAIVGVAGIILLLAMFTFADQEKRIASLESSAQSQAALNDNQTDLNKLQVNFNQSVLEKLQ